MSFLITQHSPLKHTGTQNQRENGKNTDPNKAVLPPHCPLFFFFLDINKAGCGSGERTKPHGELPLVTEVPWICWQRRGILLNNSHQGTNYARDPQPSSRHGKSIHDPTPPTGMFIYLTGMIIKEHLPRRIG